MPGAVAVIAASSDDWGFDDSRWRAWPASFLIVVAAHLVAAYVILRTADFSPDGGVSSSQPAFDVSMYMQEVVGDRPGAAQILTPGDATDAAAPLLSRDNGETAVTDTQAPEAAAEIVPSRPFDPLPSTAEAMDDPSVPVGGATVPLRSSEAALPVAPEALASRSVVALPTEAPGAASDPVPAQSSESALPREALPSPAAEVVATVLPDALTATEPASPRTLAPVEPVSIAPLQTAPEAEAMSGEVVESYDLAALPRPRPATVPEEFLRAYEEQRRAEEEARRIAQQQAAERQEAEQRQAAERAEEERQNRQRQQQAEAAAPAPAPAAEAAEPSPPRQQEAGGGAEFCGVDAERGGQWERKRRIATSEACFASYSATSAFQPGSARAEPRPSASP